MQICVMHPPVEMYIIIQEVMLLECEADPSPPFSVDV